MWKSSTASAEQTALGVARFFSTHSASLTPSNTLQDLPVERLDLLIDRIEVVATIVHAMRVEVANRDRPQEEDAASVNSTVTIAGEVSAVVN